MKLVTIPIKVYNPSQDEPNFDGAIPKLDVGVRGISGIHGDKRGESWADEQCALEDAIDSHIKEFVDALAPFAEFLREQGVENPWHKAVSAALTRRNQMPDHSASRVAGARIMSDLTPRYRALANAAKACGATVENHTYSPYVMNVVFDDGLDSAVLIREDGWYAAMWSDGYHCAEEDEKSMLCAESAIDRAIEIAKLQREEVRDNES